MFKKLLVLACIALLSFPAFAAVYLVEPVDAAPKQNEELVFGKIAQGETLKVVAKKKSGLASDWDRLSVDIGSLPAGWAAKPIETDKTLVYEITVAKNAPVSTQRIKFTLSRAGEPAFSESFYGTVSVNESLLSASIENQSQDSVFGSSASFRLLLSNDSIAEHSVLVESSLPGYWFSSQTVGLSPHETLAVELPVLPYAYGEKIFSFNVSSKQNSKRFSFPAKLDVMPTLAGIYGSSIAGLPFLSPSALPFYLINGFLSLLR